MLSVFREEGVLLHRIRASLAALATELGPHAPASADLRTDGAEVLWGTAQHEGEEQGVVRLLVPRTFCLTSANITGAQFTERFPCHLPASRPGQAPTKIAPLDSCIDERQHRSVSNQSLPAVAPVRCCPPLSDTALSADWAGELAAMFKALGDPVRLRLVSMVASHAGGEACVCDLTPAFDLSQPTISHHLRVLREAGLLECQRRGTWVFYRVVPAALVQLAAVLGPTELPAPAALTSEALV